MLKCAQCEKDILGKGYLLNEDGDFACSEECKQEYERQREDFFNRIVHDGELCEKWLLGEDV